MSEAGLNPLETILRLCDAAAPEPWYPRLYIKQADLDAQGVSRCLEFLWMSGLIEKTAGTPDSGPGIVLTREGQRVLLDPEALQSLREGRPVSPRDRAGVVRQALLGGRRPYVTLLLVLLNVLVFARGYQLAREKHIDGDFLRGNLQVQGKLQADDVKNLKDLSEVHQQTGAISAYAVIDGQWWRLLTAGFVHIGFLHLLMNMACLYFAGRFIEQMWGPVRYLAIYLVAVLGGSCLGVVHHVGLSAGASGAVCGILAAEAVWFLFNRRYLPRALLRQARANFLINLVLLVFISSFQNVSGWGHFGGAAAGALAALLMHLQRFGPPVWRWLALVGFVPMAWYGHYAIDHARATDAKWQEVEDRHFAGKYYPLVERAVKKAREEVSEREAGSLLEQHPTRRDPEKVEAALSALGKAERALNDVADQLNRAGPYGSPDAENARQTGIAYVLAEADLLAEAARVLRLGEQRTDRDRQAVREREEKVQQVSQKWDDLFKKVW